MRAVNTWGRVHWLLAGLLIMFCGSAMAKLSFFPPAQGDIASLTAEKTVVSYLQQHHRLPDYFITKRKARAAGWDHFSNREQTLPSAPGRVWREADIDYHCGRRGADRVLFANDGLIYVSRDHYKNVVRVE
jgi:hypothetical protein